MKHTKRIFALVLALMLAFGLALPAMAADNWDDFYIITEPQQNLYVPYGESFTLSVEVNIPEGVEVKYQWYRVGASYDTGISGGTGPTLQLSPGDASYVTSKTVDGYVQKIYCRIWIHIFKNDRYYSERLTSRAATVEMEGAVWAKQFMIITPPPQALYVPRGESFMLYVDVNIPDEIDEVTYQWYGYDRNGTSNYYPYKKIPGATEADLRLSPGESYYPSSSYKYGAPPSGAYCMQYYCMVTAYDHSVGATKTLSSGTVEVTVEGSFLRKLYSLTFEPFAYAFNYGMSAFPLGFIIFPVVWYERLIDNYRAVFN